jgi:transcription elongation factor GreA
MRTRLTPEGYERLSAELNGLINNELPGLAEKFKEAADDQDFEDNPEFESVRIEKAFVDRRISELSILLNNAIIIDQSSSEEIADLGSKVTLQEEDGTVSCYKLVSPIEANPKEYKISNQSPLGKTIMGRRAGEKISVNAPDGVIKYEILKIE